MAGTYLIVWSWFFLSLVSKTSSQDFPGEAEANPKDNHLEVCHTSPLSNRLGLIQHVEKLGGSRGLRMACFVGKLVQGGDLHFLDGFACSVKRNKVSPLAVVAVLPDISGGK